MYTIDKKEALKRLEKMETETAALRKIIDAPLNVFSLTTLEQMCQAAGEDISDYTVAPDASKRQMGRVLAATMELICDVMKQGVELDYGNSNQQKFYLWGIHSTGSGFSLGGVYYVGTASGVGARLSVDTHEKAEHIWKHFSHIWIAFWLGK